MRIDQLTPEQEAQLPAIRDEWLRIGLSTDPADRPRAEQAIKQAYHRAGLEPPELVLWFESPLAGLLAANIINANQVSDQVWNQVWNQVRNQVRNQVPDQVWNQVWGQVWNQVWNQVSDQVASQVSDQVRDQVANQVRSQVLWYRPLYGQHEAHWLGFYSTFQQFGLDIDITGLTELAKSVGWCWVGTNIAILTERASELHFDAQLRLHHPTQQAVVYPDGWGFHIWHGLSVPEWALSPTIEQIHAETNTEIRRAAIEAYGWEGYITDAQLSPVAEDEYGRLYDMPDDPLKVVVVVNGTPERDGTLKRYGLYCDPSVSTPLEAVAASYDVTPEEYATLQRRT